MAANYNSKVRFFKENKRFVSTKKAFEACLLLGNHRPPTRPDFMIVAGDDSFYFEMQLWHPQVNYPAEGFAVDTPVAGNSKLDVHCVMMLISNKRSQFKKARGKTFGTLVGLGLVGF